MKKIITTVVLVTAIFTVRVPTVQAHEGCVAGAVIGGIVAGVVIADALQPRPVYYSTATYCPPPASVVYAAPPVVYAPPVTYYQTASVVVYPAPVVRFGFGYVRPWGWRHHAESERGYGHRW